MPGVEYIAGGATQNSIRVAQWMLASGAPKACSYMGCVGKDKFAELMAATCREKDGVDARYMVDESTATGTCAVCVVGGERSLVANLAAANNFKVDFLKQEENMAVLQKARVVYSAGFFITVSPESIMVCAEHCASVKSSDGKKKQYCMNISAPFIVQVPPFKKALMDALPYADFLFGNETEARAFAESEGWATQDVSEIARKAADLPRADGIEQPRVVVFTQGADATVVATQGKEGVETFDVPAVPQQEIVDTNGAGDAFVGGFLAQLAKGLPVAECVRAGHYAAGVVIRRSGCTLPDKPEYK